MASSFAMIKPLITRGIARRCARTSRSVVQGRVWAARGFSSGDGGDKKDESIVDILENLKLRRPAVSGTTASGGERQQRSVGWQQQKQQQPRQQHSRGGRRPPPGPTPEPPLARDPLLRTHMIDLFPGKYDDDDDFNAGTETDPWDDDDEDEGDFEEVEAEMAKLHREEMELNAKKLKWIETTKPQVRVPVIDSIGRAYGRGARKSAQARVWITPGFGNVTVNRKDLVDYFPRFSDRELVLAPLVVTRTCGKFDLQCQVKGGGLTGQAGAIRLGVARALQHWNPEYRPPMKKMGYLTRDARRVEPKKVGLVKARKAPQWNRR
ncbi:protein S9 [Seminavis robusta]|uniref:Protein S9 n=1 Tax=Seminavis robusta TaxID=568900 RepID=A0A9N8DHQ7_9STRA|nr:protein S9 [Seminavis robusta]|eukprot:Sro91_g047660.1 protein S9 (322) ;mRNA; r:46495-47460